MTTRIVRTIAEIRSVVASIRDDGDRIAMVPTMGSLHAGHLALLEAARHHADRTIVTIFVNPAQFAPNEDFQSYPRNEAKDLKALAPFAPDFVFAPETDEIYPPGFATTIAVGGPSTGLESDARPHFFSGVATIVAKLLLCGLPNSAFFGEKDYQQLLVIKRLVADLAIPVEICACPTAREPDGLALSSRNAYLTAPERAVAPRLYATLAELAEAVRRGKAIAAAEGSAESQLGAAGFEVDYVAVRNADTLAPVHGTRTEPMRALAAVRLGRTRLIDNVAVGRPGSAL